MSKTAMIRARSDSGLKKEVERIFRQLGISTTEAINIFYRQVKFYKGFPFDIRIPNPTTLKAIEDVQKKDRLIQCDDLKDMLKKLKSSK